MTPVETIRERCFVDGCDRFETLGVIVSCIEESVKVGDVAVKELMQSLSCVYIYNDIRSYRILDMS